MLPWVPRTREKGQEPGQMHKDCPRKTQNCPRLAGGDKSERAFQTESGERKRDTYFPASRTSLLIADVNRSYF